MAVAFHDGSDYRVRPLSREAFDVLVAAGVYEAEHVELLEGSLVDMAPQGPQHGDAVRRLSRRITVELASQFHERYLVGVQTPLQATDLSEPEPDISVIDDAASSASTHPTSAHLVIEIAQTSHGIDLIRKPTIYAAAGVAQYWVVDLPADDVVVHTDPRPSSTTTPAGYGSVRRLPLDTPLEVLGISLNLRDVLSTD